MGFYPSVNGLSTFLIFIVNMVLLKKAKIAKGFVATRVQSKCIR